MDGKINAIEIEQNGIKFYIAKITVSELVSEKIHIDKYNPSTNKGYQREVSRDRARKFARFIEDKDTVSPLPLLFSIREGDVKYNDGTLKLPDSSLWLVDGQHRYEGFREALVDEPEISKFEVPIVIIPSQAVAEKFPGVDSQLYEAVLFAVINKTQKGVRSDLVDRFISEYVEKIGGARKLVERYERGAMTIFKDADFIARSISVMDLLTEDKKSPWHEGIAKPNQKGGPVTKQRSFTESLRPILADSEMKKMSNEEIAKALENYWSAFKELCPEAFEEPKKYVIQKTVGIFVLHAVFNSIVQHCKEKDGSLDLTKENLKKVINKVDHEFKRSEYWDAKNGEAGSKGSNQKSFKIIQDSINEAIDQAFSSASGKVKL